jgi:signal transduction histidine kinase
VSVPLIWFVAAVLLAFLIGWWRTRRAFLGWLRDLEQYLHDWLNEEAAETAEARKQERLASRPRLLKPVYSRHEEQRQSFLSLRSLSAATRTRLQKLIDEVSEAVLIYDPELQLLFASIEVRELAARAGVISYAAEAEADERALLKVREFVAANSDIDEFARACLATGTAPEKREVSIRAAGEERRFLATSHIVRAAREGGIAGLLLLLTDVRVLEEVRRNAIRRVVLDHVQLAAELMAHRVRNPLNSIVLVLELLRRESARSGNGTRQALEAHVETIQGEVARLEGTVEGFLEAVRRRERTLESVDLAGVVEIASELLYPVAREARVTVRQELHVPRALVQGDRVEIVRALLGPALAALRGSPPGSEMKFRLDSERRDHLLLIESEGLPPGAPEVGVAEELAARNGGSVRVDNSTPPTRLTYRYPAGEETPVSVS